MRLMCGIAGTFELEPGSAPDETLVGRMTDALAHRGPDDAGLLVDAPVLLGNRRLAILDLSPAGHQPMPTADGALWITYNGEIYNYVELRDELRGLGRSFVTGTDTEVLLQAFQEWGDEAFARLNGDFAFSIWDRTAGRLTLVRDRLGVKPLYYTTAGGRFRFASEIKALLLDPAVPRRPNEDRLGDFLARGLIDHTSETLFEGIEQLAPGCMLAVTAAGAGRQQRWYTAHAAPRSKAPVADSVRELFVDAVRLRLRSDVPVGTALSGGMDSSSVMTVATMLNREAGAGPPTSFSARSNDPKVDEGRYIAEVVAATGGRNVDVFLTAADAASSIDELLWFMDEPFHSPTVYGHWRVLGRARAEGMIVMLEGQAGDEVFCGYDHLLPAFVYSFLRSGKLRAAFETIDARAAISRVGRRRAILDIAKHLAPASLRARRVPPWLGERLAGTRAVVPARDVRSHQRHLLGVTPLPAFLHHDDRNSMSVGVESRSPFFDHRLAEAAMALRPGELLRDGVLKWPLRAAMRGLVPDAIVDRRDKQGFSVDQNEWVGGRLGDVIDATLGEPETADRGYVRIPELRTLLAEVRAGGRGIDELWRAFITERWMRIFIDPELVEVPAAARLGGDWIRAGDRVTRLAEPVARDAVPAPVRASA
jgi:asparagine synthase (glutamine-hydrolysing)